jgi:uncharacterized protein involved in type VI secretion and phage assembly
VIAAGPFEIATPGVFAASYLAEVVDVSDPDNLARVQIRLLSADGVGDQDGPIWARVAVPFAGGGRGAFLLPDVGDEVLVSFVNGDPRFPIVAGGLWNGAARAPETLGGDRIDRWTLVGKAGTRIAIVEASAGAETISFTTPGGVSGKLTAEDGGRITLDAAGTTITVDSDGVAVSTQAKVTVQASEIEATAGQVTVNAATATFSGVVQCETLIATTVTGTTYTPGAGNVW